MKLSLLSVPLAVLFGTVVAHTVFTTLFIDDVSQGDGTCVRMPMNPSTATDPVNDLSSNDMACGRSSLVPNVVEPRICTNSS